MSYAGKTVVITGGAGYIGTNLVNLLAEEDVCIRCLYRAGQPPAALSGKARFENITGDLREETLWPRLLPDAEVVFLLAAQTSIYTAQQNPTADLEANVLPILRLLESCRQNKWRPHVVLASTVTLAGVNPQLPVDEATPDQPVTVYDLHKQMAEGYLKHYAREGVVTATILRLANVYGPGPKSSRTDRGILNQMVRKALKGEALTVYGDGCHLRDYVYVEDVAHAFLAAGQPAENLNGRHFVIGSSRGCSVATAVKLAAERVALKIGRAVPINHVEWPAGLSPIETRNFVANSTAFAQATGWQAKTELTDGLDRTIAAFRAEATGSI